MVPQTCRWLSLAINLTGPTIQLSRKALMTPVRALSSGVKLEDTPAMGAALACMEVDLRNNFALA